MFHPHRTAVSAQQSFIHRLSPDRLLFLRLHEDGPDTLLLTQNHPGKSLTDLYQPFWLYFTERKIVLFHKFNLVSSHFKTCVNAATSRLFLPYKKKPQNKTLVANVEESKAKCWKPCQLYWSWSDKHPAILAKIFSSLKFNILNLHLISKTSV